MTIKPFQMRIQPPTADQPAVVELSGVLDAHSVAEFETSLGPLLKVEAPTIMIDLERLDYLSSARIGALMAIQQEILRRKGHLALVRPAEKVQRLLQSLGFDRIFSIVDSRAGALSLLASRSAS
jgi:anti-anti-sigma factor